MIFKLSTIKAIIFFSLTTNYYATIKQQQQQKLLSPNLWFYDLIHPALIHLLVLKNYGEYIVFHKLFLKFSNSFFDLPCTLS